VTEHPSCSHSESPLSQGGEESDNLPKDVKKFCVPEAEIYCDGASSGNPGHAGIGVVIVRQKLQVASHESQVTSDLKPETCNLQPETYRISEYIGVTTNNVAEYSALIRGLEKAKSLGLRRIDIFVDSELLVKQIKGLYKVKSTNLKPLWKKTQNILKQLDYRITHVQRELNREADLLAKKAIKSVR
jgi:ribonuclease HI